MVSWKELRAGIVFIWLLFLVGGSFALGRSWQYDVFFLTGAVLTFIFYPSWTRWLEELVK